MKLSDKKLFSEYKNLPNFDARSIISGTPGIWFIGISLIGTYPHAPRNAVLIFSTESPAWPYGQTDDLGVIRLIVIYIKMLMHKGLNKSWTVGFKKLLIFKLIQPKIMPTLYTNNSF